MILLRRVGLPRPVPVPVLTRCDRRHTHDEHTLQLTIDGERHSFPHVWLRDNCRCDSCYQRDARSRTVDWDSFPLDARVRDVRREGGEVRLTWDDGHLSRYEERWLLRHAFSEGRQARYDVERYRPPRRPWGEGEGGLAAALTLHRYEDVVSSDAALYGWLRALAVHGVALVRGAPGAEGAAAVLALAARCGGARQTHYGRTFTVRHVPRAANVAYRAGPLPLHTDLPYYEHCPGLNLLHCQRAARAGGHNLLADGLRLAHELRRRQPPHYRALCETEVEWRDVGEQDGRAFHKLHRAPVLRLDAAGRLRQLRASTPQRGAHFPGALREARPWYAALHALLREARRQAAPLRTAPGDVLAFDNWRVLHGRAPYDERAGEERRLQGAYLDWDEVYCTMRRLRART